MDIKIEDPAIPLDSVVVVVGANGYIGVETCEKLLQAGFRVRGTVRDVDRHRAWMHDLFDAQWLGKFELVRVTDFEEEGTFDEAFKGAAGVIYVSTPIIFDKDPSKAIDPTVKGTLNVLKSAAHAGVQRLVLNSSSKAVESTSYDGPPHTLTTDTFNHEALRRARSPGPIIREEDSASSFDRAFTVYSAGRTAAELRFWSWVRENADWIPFVANCVVPDGNFGRVLGGGRVDGSSVGMLRRALAGEWDGVFPRLAYFIDVEDTARLSVAAVALRSLANERVFAYYRQATWNDLRRRVRKLFPDRPRLVTGEDLVISGRDMSSAEGPIRHAEDILKAVGRSGFVGEDDMLQDFVRDMYPEL